MVIRDFTPGCSAFAQLVDRLRNYPDAELKLLFIRFFKNELEQE